MMRLLVSVRDEDEALAAAGAGADFIDLKDPAAGALGALAPRRIEHIVGVLRRRHPATPVSATVGDWPAARVERILGCVRDVAACGVDYVKVGIEPGPAAVALLRELARSGAAVVPVLLADRGVDQGLVDVALSLDAFPVLMLDTADKRGGSLLQRLPASQLAGFVSAVRRGRRSAGLAGALRLADVPALRALGPDVAGFRSAVCAGDRAGALDPARVRELQLQLYRDYRWG